METMEMICKQCKQRKTVEEMSKSGYQRKTGQAKYGICKKCNNANLILYKNLKADTNSVPKMLEAYKILVQTVHNDTIPMVLPKYIRDALAARYPYLAIEIKKRPEKSSRVEAEDIYSYFAGINTAMVDIPKHVNKDASTTLLSLMTDDLLKAGNTKRAIQIAEKYLVSARNEEKCSSTFTEVQMLKQEVQELEDAIYAGTDMPIQVSGYKFSIEEIDDRGMCDCPDAGDCFCDTCLNFVTVVKAIVKTCEDKMN